MKLLNLAIATIAILSSLSAYAEKRSVDVTECEKRIEALALGGYQAGIAWVKVQHAIDARKPFTNEMEKLTIADDNFRKIKADAISCLYE
jgi:hypothetical protein